MLRESAALRLVAALLGEGDEGGGLVGSDGAAEGGHVVAAVDDGQGGRPCRERQGPRRPPVPDMRWQSTQPLSMNTCAPRAASPLSDCVTSTGSACTLVAGDHGEAYPVTISTPIVNTTSATPPTAQGRRLGARSPVAPRNGTRSSTTTSRTGKPRMMKLSMFAGESASSANSQTKYQSGCGSAWMIVGSAGWPSAGAPTTIARSSTNAPTA